ncbi:DUF1919 domain-containing protein [Faecalimonas umbilicata]|uniref:DUF1919 domain-containing protein n=1 Tax=Faecalimonas umbilicata TaxID=1912855 RepID=UPI0022E2E36F|nr:DUF1919 domain-containing protein [Faecalimonas umbilicata]
MGEEKLIFKELIKKYNPVYKRVREKRKERLQNNNFTILCSNCIGGVIYHELGLKFLSPTINCRMDSPDFIKFVLNIKYYLDCKLEFVTTDNSFPVAKLDDITVYFVHYLTIEEAEKKWNERKQRINWDNIYILTNDLDNVTQDELMELKKITWAKSIAVFSCRHYENLPFVYKLSELDMENYLKINPFTGKRIFEKYFDYVKWLNQ